MADEPFAWAYRYEGKPKGRTDICVARHKGAIAKGWVEIPLYTRATPPAEPTEAMIEAGGAVIREVPASPEIAEALRVATNQAQAD